MRESSRERRLTPCSCFGWRSNPESASTMSSGGAARSRAERCAFQN